MVDRFVVGVGQTCGIGWNEKGEKTVYNREERKKK